MRVLDNRISVFLLVIILLSTGCVYLRLLQVKNQLNDFEGNFDLKDQNGLKLVFKNPVLLSRDIVWLTKNNPISREHSPEGENWLYILEKQHADENNEAVDYDIPLTFYIRDDKVVEIAFPERFLENLSIPLLIKILGAMGKSEITKSKRSAGTEFKGGNTDEMPKKRYILSVLGSPYKNEKNDKAIILTYLYNFKSNEAKNDDRAFNLKMTFSFREHDELLQRAEYNFNGLTMSLSLAAEEKKSDK